MTRVRRAADRGHFDHGWLDTYHTFSFADYYDPAHHGFRALRVINEDRVDAGRGFGMHPHRDMEIITFVLEGALEHKDSTGGGGVIRPGDLQHMTAGSGVLHSEFNPSKTEPVHLYQIWIKPRQHGLPPRYAQQAFDRAAWQGRLHLVAGPAGASDLDGALPIQADARLYAATLKDGETVTHAIPDGRHAWLQVVRGAVSANGQELGEGDGLAVSEEAQLTVASRGGAEVLVFDLA